MNIKKIEVENMRSPSRMQINGTWLTSFQKLICVYLFIRRCLLNFGREI